MKFGNMAFLRLSVASILSKLSENLTLIPGLKNNLPGKKPGRRLLFGMVERGLFIYPVPPG